MRRIVLPLSVPLFAFAMSAACSSASTHAAGAAADASIDVVTTRDAASGSNADRIDGAARALDAAIEPTPIAVPPSGVQAGATVIDDETVVFRVWAPNATSAKVAGDFTSSAITLEPEANGYFAKAIAGAHAGQHYRFLFEHDGAPITRSDPRARAFANGTSDSIIVDPRTYAWASAPFTAPSPANVILYELHVASFGTDGSSNGTFTGVIARLDHLHDLGVNMIELMPANQYDGSVGWGYNPTGYDAPSENYGSPDDLRALVDAAHARGIGVMLDVVYNHYDGAESGLWCFDGACASDGGTDRGIYFFDDSTYGMTPWGPRPAYATQAVHDFIEDGVFGWLSEFRLDGFRWDSVANIRAIDGAGSVPGGVALLQDTNTMAHARFPNALMIAEDYKGDANVTASVASGGLGFDAQWDGWNGAINGAVTAATDAARSMSSVASAITYNYNGVAAHRVIFTENHDLDGNGSARLPSVIDASDPTSLLARKKSMLAAAILFTSPGIPMLFEGQEMLATGTFANPPALLDWSLATTNAPILAYYKDLARLRSNLDGDASGLSGDHVNVFHLNDSVKVIAYDRTNSGTDDVIVVANFSSTAFAQYDLGFPSAGPWHTRFNGDAKIYSSDFGGTPSGDVVTTNAPRDGFPCSATLALAPYSALVFSK